MTMKWQSFVPDVRAGAQAVLNEDTGAAIDLILAAGARHGGKVKVGEIFATHPGHHAHEMDHFLYKHVIVTTTAHDDAAGHWQASFMSDKTAAAFIRADFMRIDGKLALKLTAENHSPERISWVVTLLASPNDRCKDAKTDDTCVSAKGRSVSFAFDSKWFNTPPLDSSCAFLNGMLLEWGMPCPANRSFLNYFREWTLEPGQTDSRWIVAGDVKPDFAAGDNTRLSKRLDKLIAEGGKTPGVLPNDPFGAGIRHIVTQTLANRFYPPKLECKGRPFPIFCPGPSYSYEYFWDAGFIAIGLAAVAPQEAEECISQYLPGNEGTIFPNLVGAPSLVQVIAAWELYQATRDKGVLSRLHAKLHDLFLCCSGIKPLPNGVSLDEEGDGLVAPIGGGSGLDDAPSQIWTRGYSIGWARQNHYWVEPFEVNPTGKAIRTASVNMTALTLLSARLLKETCQLLGLAEPPEYGEYIGKTVAALERHAWNGSSGHYHWTVKNTHEQCPYYDLSGLTPLFCGAELDDARMSAMLDNLMGKYVTGYGLTTVDVDAPFFRKGYWCGAVWMPFHWLFWKALLGMGRIEDAERMAQGIIESYTRNFNNLPACYEKFDQESGEGCGEFSFSGLSTIILNLWAGYRKPGTLTTGFLAIPDTVAIDKDLRKAEIRLTVKERGQSTGVLIVMKPNSRYAVEAGGRSQTLVSDKFGCLRIAAPVVDGTANLKISLVD